MNKEKLQKYLGMAVHFVYYHYERLYKSEVFPIGYWQELLEISDIEYLQNMRDCLEYALTKDDYCLGILNSPHLEHYSENEIRLFFEKFYNFLSDNLKNSSDEYI